MGDAVGELLKQARVVLAERTPASNKARQALNLIAKAPRLDKDVLGRTKFAVAMALRGLCLSYRNTPARLRETSLASIENTAALLEGLADAPQDSAYQRWMTE